MASEASSFIQLYLDEDVHESLLPALRQRGYEVLNVRQAKHRSLSDVEQLPTPGTLHAAPRIR